MNREIVMDVSRENIERGIAEEVKQAMAMSELSETEKSFAYPNPFSQEVGINFYQQEAGLTSIRILDGRGRFISEQRYELDRGSQQIYLGEEHFQVSGLFILQLVSGDQVDNFRVLYQAD